MNGITTATLISWALLEREGKGPAFSDKADILMIHSALARVSGEIDRPGSALHRAAEAARAERRLNVTPPTLQTDTDKALAGNGGLLGRQVAWHLRADARARRQTELDRVPSPAALLVEAGVSGAVLHQAIEHAVTVAGNDAAGKPRGDGWPALQNLLGARGAEAAVRAVAPWLQGQRELETLKLARDNDPYPESDSDPGHDRLRESVRGDLQAGLRDVARQAELAKLKAEARAQNLLQAKIELLELETGPNGYPGNGLVAEARARVEALEKGTA